VGRGSPDLPRGAPRIDDSSRLDYGLFHGRHARVDSAPIVTVGRRLGADAVSWLSDSILAVTCDDTLRLANIETGRQISSAITTR